MTIRKRINEFATAIFCFGTVGLVFSILYHMLSDCGWMTTAFAMVVLMVAGCIVDFCTREREAK